MFNALIESSKKIVLSFIVYFIISINWLKFKVSLNTISGAWEPSGHPFNKYIAEGMFLSRQIKWPTKGSAQLNITYFGANLLFSRAFMIYRL